MIKAKVVAIFEKDGVTPKRSTHRVDYSNVIGRTWNMPYGLEVGRGTLLISIDKDCATVETSTIEDFESDGVVLRVVTRNTIYLFDIIEV